MKRSFLILAFIVGLTGATVIRDVVAFADTPDAAATVTIDASTAAGTTDAGVIAAVTIDAGIAPIASPPIIVPVINIQTAMQDEGVLADLYHKGLIVDAGIVLAFLALQFAAARSTFLKADHHVVWVTAALTALAGLVAIAVTGSTPNRAQVFGALITGVSLIINPKKLSQPKKPDDAPPSAPTSSPAVT